MMEGFKYETQTLLPHLLANTLGVLVGFEEGA